ncbi:MAG: NAD(P)/FAD-dependent oxidoreductase [Clostridia bacterium]|nr:NAD(P)/FAD-dependent oxidoreductase [Clostridia bacterium]
MFDCAIIGTGPAGISAALNLQIHNKHFLWLGNRDLSEKVTKAEKISNYPGFPDADGATLNAAFRRQIDAMGMEITDRMVTAVYPMGGHYALAAGADFYEAKTLILATGVAATGVLPGETAFLGRGVSYCATCDGGLYRKKTVAVISSNPRFAHEVSFLCELADTVYFFPTYRGDYPKADNLRMPDARPREIIGEQRVTALSLSDGSTLPVDGVFCLRDAVSLATLLPGLACENGHIVVDREMKTNLPGVFAAGDCTGRPYQYTKAVGEGNVAAHSVIKALS